MAGEDIVMFRQGELKRLHVIRKVLEKVVKQVEWSVSITLRHWPEEFIVAILRSLPVWAD